MKQQTKLILRAFLSGILLLNLSLRAQTKQGTYIENPFKPESFILSAFLAQMTPSPTLPKRGECDYELVSLEIDCQEPAYDGQGNVLYAGKFTVVNNSLFPLRLDTHPAALTSSSFWGIDIPGAVFTILPPTPGCIGVLTVCSGGSCLNPSQTYTACFTLSVPIGTTSFNFLSRGFTRFGTLNQAECRIGENISLLACTCDLCEDWEFVDTTAIIQPAPTYIPGYNYTLTQNFQINGADPIIEMKAEVVYVQHLANDTLCYLCTKEESEMGLIHFRRGLPRDVSATGLDWRNNNNGIPTQDVNTDNYSNQAVWQVMDPATGIDFSSSPVRQFVLPISLPLKNSLQCCEHTYEVCVRYTFTDIHCKTCDFLSCYKITVY